MNISEGIAMLVTHSFEVNNTGQTDQGEKIILKRGEIYPLLHSYVSLLDNGDGSYTDVPTYLINYKKNGTYIPIYIQACSGIKIINQNKFDTDKYLAFLNNTHSDASSYRRLDPIRNVHDILPITPAGELEFTFDGKTVRASANFLRIRPASLFPLDTPIEITDGAWNTSTYAINISFSLYILDSNEIRIAFEANSSREYWDGNGSYDDYIDKMKEIIEEYPYLVMDHFQDDATRTHFAFSCPYKTETKDEPLERVINWAYDIISDIRSFTDKRIMFLLQEQE